MPITIKLDEKTGRLRSRGTGTLTYADFLIHLKETRPRKAPGLPELFDARGVSTDMTTVQIRALSYVTQELSNRGVLGASAFVATDDTLFGMARMYASFGDGLTDPIQIFRGIACAEEWLASLGSVPFTFKAMTPAHAFAE
jgi:hypothetical protein